jgi:hypothetical protein
MSFKLTKFFIYLLFFLLLCDWIKFSFRYSFSVTSWWRGGLNFCPCTQVDDSGPRFPSDPAGTSHLSGAFRPYPHRNTKEPAEKQREYGSSIPAGISPYRNRPSSKHFPLPGNERNITVSCRNITGSWWKPMGTTQYSIEYVRKPQRIQPKTNTLPKDFSSIFHPRTNPLVLRIFQAFFILRSISWSSKFFNDFSSSDQFLRSQDFSSSDQFFGPQDFSRIFQGFLILRLSCFSLEDFSMSFHPRTNPLVLRIFQGFF